MSANVLPLFMESSITKKIIPIATEYTLGQKINSGSFGTVYKATHKLTKQTRAVKVIKKHQAESKEIKNEVNILSKLVHPNIMKIYEIFKDKTNYYIVSEFYNGGELFEILEDTSSISQDFIRSIIRQILSAICYAHNNKICHRDLKPENIMLEKKRSCESVKIIDWGSGATIKEGTTMTEVCGTSYYIAPEVVKQSYTEKCDIWSIGVIFYMLLVGYAPFDGDTDDDIIKSALEGKADFTSEEWKDVDADAKNLVKKMLTYNPEKRPSAKECLKHNYFAKKMNKNDVNSKISIKVFDRMKKIRRNLQIEQSIVNFIVNNYVSKEENEELMKVFKSWDLNADGVLSREEIIKGYKTAYNSIANDNEIDQMIKSVDLDGSGTIDYNEFLNFAINQDKILNQQHLKMAFKSFDTDNSGKISFAELENIFKKGNKNWGEKEKNALNELLKQVDENGDGEISFSEFQNVVINYFK